MLEANVGSPAPGGNSTNGCVVVPCRDAAALAAAIGTVAARRGAADVRLQQLALPYTIANAIANHVAVLQL